MEVERKSRYLTFTDRQIIEKMYNMGEIKRTIAFRLGVSPATITREIPRGLVPQRDSLWREFFIYSAQTAQDKADYANTGKGRPLKIGNDFKLAKYIEDQILKGYSPDVVLGVLSKEGRKPFSTNTLYRYIDSGLIFTRITNKNLLEKMTRKRTYKKVRKYKKAPVGTSIEHRPSHIDSRDEFGHWEMDCVIGKSKGTNQALLVLTERKTNYEMIFKLRQKTAHWVVRTLDDVLSILPRGAFKTCTVDNGPEFSDCYGMEHDKRRQKRIDVYYCHPYTSCERGINERMNRMIRRFFPKGQSLDKTTTKQARAVADWLNEYPRRRLNYATPAELFARELSQLTT